MGIVLAISLALAFRCERIVSRRLQGIVEMVHDPMHDAGDGLALGLGAFDQFRREVLDALILRLHLFGRFEVLRDIDGQRAGLYRIRNRGGNHREFDGRLDVVLAHDFDFSGRRLPIQFQDFVAVGIRPFLRRGRRRRGRMPVVRDCLLGGFARGRRRRHQVIGEIFDAALIRWSANHGGVFDMERRGEGAIQNKGAGLRRSGGRKGQDQHEGEHAQTAVVSEHIQPWLIGCTSGTVKNLLC